MTGKRDSASGKSIIRHNFELGGYNIAWDVSPERLSNVKSSYGKTLPEGEVMPNFINFAERLSTSNPVELAVILGYSKCSKDLPIVYFAEQGCTHNGRWAYKNSEGRKRYVDDYLANVQASGVILQMENPKDYSIQKALIPVLYPSVPSFSLLDLEKDRSTMKLFAPEGTKISRNCALETIIHFLNCLEEYSIKNCADGYEQIEKSFLPKRLDLSIEKAKDVESLKEDYLRRKALAAKNIFNPRGRELPKQALPFLKEYLEIVFPYFEKDVNKSIDRNRSPGGIKKEEYGAVMARYLWDWLEAKRALYEIENGGPVTYNF